VLEYKVKSCVGQKKVLIYWVSHYVAIVEMILGLSVAIGPTTVGWST